MNVESAKFNLPAVFRAFSKGKLGRADFRRELVKTGYITKRELALERLDKHGCMPKTARAIRAYDEELTACIVRRDLNLLPIRCFQ